MPADLHADTTPRPVASGTAKWTGHLGDAWNFRTPSGGVLTTLGLRAIEAAISRPDLRLVAATATFVRPVSADPIGIDVEILREGRAALQARSTLRDDAGEIGLEIAATFGVERAGFAITEVKCPDLPGPDDLEDLSQLRSADGFAPNFFRNIESRLASGACWWEKGWKAGPARCARWYRYRVPQIDADGNFDRMAIAPIADTMPPSLVQAMGPEHPPLWAPSLDLTIHFLAPSKEQWMLADARTRWAANGYASAQVEIWDRTGALVAFATQTMMLRRAPATRPPGKA